MHKILTKDSLLFWLKNRYHDRLFVGHIASKPWCPTNVRSAPTHVSTISYTLSGTKKWNNNMVSIKQKIAGVDEAGRGPLAGPVVAAAVILNPRRRIPGLNDSKLLTALQREELFALIQKRSLAWAIGKAGVEEIDTINILQASLLAMKRAVESLGIEPDLVRVDGNQKPKIAYAVSTHVDGDKLLPEISAASIVAKVVRDREMVELDKLYPGYGFADHKGYSTPFHFMALQELGVSEIHRRSFGPIKELLQIETALPA